MTLETLKAFKAEFEAKSVEWGNDDCTAWAGIWASRHWGVDINLPKYSDRKGARNIIECAGGLVPLISQYLGPSEGYGEPNIGDIAVIKTGRSGDVTVIMLHHNYAIWRAEKGFIHLLVRPDIIKAFWKKP